MVLNVSFKKHTLFFITSEIAINQNPIFPTLSDKKALFLYTAVDCALFELTSIDIAFSR